MSRRSRPGATWPKTELPEGDIASGGAPAGGDAPECELGAPVFSVFGLILAARIAELLGLDEMTVRMHAAADVLLEECAFQLNVDDPARAAAHAALRADNWLGACTRSRRRPAGPWR